ncbi:glycosyl hydrolase [Nonlabens spongiae]|uniref:Glycosyl hydrolase n=1 Tax=Nonlabens spongiae TaxID=331648 RepID=A0A1W6MKX6_9FLAO|nr:T9SS type A sorting domain-containing protein [Nonlabens spongiae]ARN78250.1 glycosyl hydrolase [Nonlabens spongiae]
MKRLSILPFLLIFIMFNLSHSQALLEAPWMQELLLEKSPEELTYQEIKAAGDAYWETHDKEVKGSGFKPYMRWLETAKAYVKKDGTLQTNAEFIAELQNTQTLGVLSDDSNWLPVGPFTYTNAGSWSAGQGRVNSMTVDPNDPNTYYIGSPGGGTWKSTDAGVTWTPLNDFISRVGSSAVAIDPNDSDIIYVGTGDDDAGDAPSIGLLKSTDGGITFNATGLQFFDTFANISEVYIDPTDSNKIVVSSNRGLYISTNAGITFNRTFFGNVKDVKFKPGDVNTLYISTLDSFHRSTNGGQTWTEISAGLPFNMGRSVIGVTPANANYVYLLIIDSQAQLLGVYRSTNSGLSFSQRDRGQDILESGQGWYDLALEVDSNNANTIYTGCLNMWKSTNGGSNFFKMNNWNQPNDPAYVHADVHQIRQFGNELFALTDGGVYRSTNGGSSFMDLTAGAQIGQFYRIAVGQSSADLAGGLQDNGGFLRKNDSWTNYHGADGMDAGIDPNNSDLRYSFTQFGGSLNISTNGISRAGSVQGPEQGNWITPLKTDSQGNIYAGYSSLYKMDSNFSWQPVSQSFGGNIDVLEIDPNDDSTIYIGYNSFLYRSDDAGVNFSFVQNFNDNIAAIEVNGNSSNTVYVSTSSSFGRVYRSTDNGNTFSDITYDLPNLGKNALAHQPLNAIENLYVGTSAGVYRLQDNATSWEPFLNNLPNSSIRDLEINTNDGIMTAATYGRGVWQTAIPVVAPAIDVAITRIITDGGDLACAASPLSLEIRNNGTSQINQIDLAYTLNNQTAVTSQIAVAVAPGNTQIVNLPNLSLSTGTNNLAVEVSVPNDAFSSNNSRSIEISINQSGAFNDTYTFETRDFLTNDSNTWQRGVPNGFVLNSAGAGSDNFAYATNLNGNHDNQLNSYLYSGCYDFSNVSTAQLSFEMAFEIEQDWDLLYMEYSTDQGASWDILGSSNDPNWYNSSRFPNGSNCFNCVGAQWTGSATTMATYSHGLDFLSGESNVIFRFSFVTDQSVTEEGAVIDNFVISGTASNAQAQIENDIQIYPNPSSGAFNISWNSGSEFTLKVFDLSGKMISEQSVSGNATVLQLDHVSQGVYLLEISSGEGAKSTHKLIKS